MGAGAALRMLRHVPRYCEVQVLLLVGDTWQAEGGWHRLPHRRPRPVTRGCVL